MRGVCSVCQEAVGVNPFCETEGDEDFLGDPLRCPEEEWELDSHNDASGNPCEGVGQMPEALVDD